VELMRNVENGLMIIRKMGPASAAPRNSYQELVRVDGGACAYLWRTAELNSQNRRDKTCLVPLFPSYQI